MYIDRITKSYIIAANRTLKRDVKLKNGKTFPKGTSVEVKFLGDKESGHLICEVLVGSDSFKTLIAKLPTTVSGFTKPSTSTMRKWISDGIAKTPTGKRTEPDGYGDDGSPSWLLALGLI